jgi:Cdc6-like AAA superfamily ATPase
MQLSLNQKLELVGVGNMPLIIKRGVKVEEMGLKNQIDRLEVLRVATCLKSHAFKKYTNEQLETIIEDLKDVLKGLKEFNDDLVAGKIEGYEGKVWKGKL